nr:MAG TPA: hypothetical protein [Caudoviricetes sp.]
MSIPAALRIAIAAASASGVMPLALLVLLVLFALRLLRVGLLMLIFILLFVYCLYEPHREVHFRHPYSASFRRTQSTPLLKFPLKTSLGEVPGGSH